jgi:hypothetical protein
MIKSINNSLLKFKLTKVSVFMALVSMITLFSSCTKEDDPIVEPKTVINVTSVLDGASRVSGTSIKLEFTANSDNGLKRVVVKYKSANAAEVVKFDTMLTSQPTSFSFSRNYTVGPIGTETYTISVTDKKDNIETKSINIKSITGFDDELFGKIYHILGTNPGAFDLIMNEQRVLTDADADKDMASNDAAGVFTGGWEAKNGTMYVRAAGFNYSSGTINDAKVAYAAGTPKSNVVAPVTNDIYIAKLRGTDTYTVIKIIANELLNDECGCTNKGKLSFNFKKSL